MSSVQAAAATTAPTQIPAQAPTATTSNIALLPPAPAPCLGAAQDVMSQLYAALGKLRDIQMATSKSHVEEAQAQQERVLAEQKEASRRAKEASEKGGLFDWLSKDIGLAGAVGLCTFNYALVAADVAVHKLDIVENVKVDVVDVAAVATGRWEVLAADILLRKTDIAPEEARAILEKVGIPRDAPGISDEDVRPIAKDLLMLNLLVASIAATVLSCGSTTAICIALAGIAISAAGTQVAKHKTFDGVLGNGSSEWIGLGMEIYGATAASMAGMAPGASSLAQNGARAAMIVNGGSSILRGGDKIATTINTRARDEANIDVEAAKQQLKRLERMVELLIDGLKETQQSHKRAAEALQGAVQSADQAQLAIAQGTRV